MIQQLQLEQDQMSLEIQLTKKVRYLVTAIQMTLTQASHFWVQSAALRVFPENG